MRCHQWIASLLSGDCPARELETSLEAIEIGAHLAGQE